MVVAFAVFLPFALLASACSIAMNAWLFHEQLRPRLAQQSGPHSGQEATAAGPAVPCAIRRRQTFEQLAERFLLRKRHQAHQERASANAIEVKQFGMSLLLMLTEVGAASQWRRRLWLHSANRLLVGLRRTCRSSSFLPFCSSAR